MDRILNVKLLAILCLLVHDCVGPPAKTKDASAQPKPEEGTSGSIDDLGLEYNRYLKEVVDALESDPEFRKKLETAQEADFRNGKVAAELEYVNHHVRTKLDELKRTELQRLRDLVQKEEHLKNEITPDNDPGHIDHTNPHTFEQADLHKLILQVRKDLEEADKKRREEFKEYELQKKFEQEQKLKIMDEEHKKQFLHELEEQKKKHQQHEPLHHPGSRAQLEDVWEKQDHMENQKFNPKTFFMFHDINGDGYWDEDEVKALFLKELDKLYQAGAPEDDMREREEEMERMREHVMKESDENGDRLISYDEFLAQTKKQEFNKDEGWDTIDTQPQYSQQEYEEFERQRQMEIQRLIDQGLLQPYAPGMMPPPPHGYDPQHPGQYHQQYPQPGVVPPNPVPPHVANAAYHPGAVPPNQQPQHVANAAYHPGAVPANQQPQHGAYHPQAVPPQGQYHPQGQPIGQPQYQPPNYQPPQQVNQGSAQPHPGQPAPPQQNPHPSGQVTNQNVGQNPNQPHSAGQVPSGQYQQNQYQPPQYQNDPNHIAPHPNANTNQQAPPSYQVPASQNINQQALPNQVPNQQAQPNQQIPSSNQVPSHQVPSPNQMPQAPNQGQAPQQPRQGNYGSISSQQDAAYQQNQLHPDLNKAPSKDIPPKH